MQIKTMLVLEFSSRSGAGLEHHAFGEEAALGGSKPKSDVTPGDFRRALHGRALYGVSRAIKKSPDVMPGIGPMCYRVPELSGSHGFVVAGDFKSSQHLPEAKTRSQAAAGHEQKAWTCHEPSQTKR